MAALANALALALLIAACARAPSGLTGPTLEPGGLVELPGGGLLAASDGALDAPLLLDLRPVAAPFDAHPLPTGTEAVGAPFRLAAERDAYAMGLEVLVIGAPLPPDGPTDDLALALLEPPDPLDHGHSEMAEWVLLPGTYDEEEGVLAVSLGAISAAGRVMVVVRHPAFDSRPTATAPTGAVVRSHVLEVVDGFMVRCLGFAPACSDHAVDTTLETLETAHAAWVGGLGFPEPRLTRQVTVVRWHPLHVRIGPYEYELRNNVTHASCEEIGGGYRRHSSIAFTCYDPSNEEPRHRTTRHELFHAVQYGYPEHLRLRGSISNAVAEGTAVAAETSIEAFRRSPGRSVRSIEPRLFPVMGDDDLTEHEYRAQDFWVYLGFRFGMGLEYLQPILATGATLSNVDTVLRTHAGYPESLSLSDAYWDWVRNQVFEKTVDITGGGTALGHPCTLATSATDEIEVQVRRDAVPAPLTRTLEPLSSIVVGVHLTGVATGHYAANIGIDSSLPAATRAKLYARALGTADCVGDPEGLIHALDVTSSTSRYLLLSNTDLHDTIEVTVGFGGLGIVAPASGASVDEGEPIEFRAVAPGLDLGARASIEWSYVRHDGLPFVFGTTTPGETLTASPFCDGDRHVTARVRDAAGAWHEASVRVIVNDLGATNPPPQCAPSVTIVEPLDGTTVPAGQTIAFAAIYDDGQPGTTTPKYPLTWRLCCVFGFDIGEGPAIETSLPIGEHRIDVSYGSASDTVTVHVLDTAQPPPSATILTPADGAQFPWSGSGATVSIDLGGVGTSSTHGTLTGASLQWFAREDGGSWTAVGTGSPSQLVVSHTGCDSTAYDVRLLVTDPDGLTGSATHRIQVFHPPC